jgi:uncharacterized membrane protein YgdD (TMEM256/DUF423 family)
MTRLFFSAGALLGAIAVMAGAFGAHALEGRVTPERLQTFETAARYQMVHALALFAVAWATTQWPAATTSWAGILFLVGVVLFSGSLYALVLTDTAWLGAITPFGGVALIAGWLALAWSVLRTS